jgi:hypothetical protein
VGLWTARNYAVFKQIIPLQMPYTNMYAKHTYILREELIPMTGNDIQPWTQGSVGQWFFPYFLENKYVYPKDPIKEHPFSSKDFTPDFNLDSLILLRERYHNSFRSEFSVQERKKYEELTLASINFYVASYKKHRPFRYYLLSPLEITFKFFFVKRLSNFPFPKLAEMKLYQKVLKALSIVFYNLIVLLGILGFIMAVWEKKWLALLICTSVIPYIGLITIYYKVLEHRYFATAYPFFTLFAAYVVVTMYERLVRKKALPTPLKFT